MKNGFYFLFILVHFFPGGVVYALPAGGEVAAGSATISLQNELTLNISQGTDRAVINWNQFNIAQNEGVIFVQPNNNAVALNRITGGDPSSILGSLSANGHIYLVNSNGIFFGPNATLNVGGLVASTFDIKDDDFLSGKTAVGTPTPFQEADTVRGSIVNQGTLAVSDGGFVFLVAPSVTNEGLIRAHGGEVVLMSHGGSDILSSVVNQSGIIEAKSLVNRGGVIRLIASDPVENTGQIGWQTHLGEVKGATGRVIDSGTLNVAAREPNAEPGEVTLSGREVEVSGIILAQGTREGGRVLVTSSHQTILKQDAKVDTSGIGVADAGNIVIWSDKNAGFAGTLLARGGEQGGRGGDMEVSGHEQLRYLGSVNASAPNGTPGSLLIDPKNIEIVGSGLAALANVDSFSDPDLEISGTKINPNTITAVMFQGNSVTLRANNDIFVNAGISVDPSGTVGGDLTLQAGRSITINQDIVSNQGSITLIANETGANGVTSRGDGPAKIEMLPGTTLDAKGANISITLSTGSGEGKSDSGNIILGNLTTSVAKSDGTRSEGNIVVTNNGPTSSILPASSNALITGKSVIFDIRGGGSIGEGTSKPIRIRVERGVEAKLGTGSTFLESDGDLTVGIPTAINFKEGISGIDSKGQVFIKVVGGKLTVDEAIKAGGEITLLADTMVLKNSINAGSARVTLRPNTNDRGINLGSTFDTATDALELSNAELNQITTSGVLQIGGVDNGVKTSGAITISDPINTGDKVSTLSLISGSSIGQTPTAPASLTEQNLRVEAIGRVTLTDADNKVDTITGKTPVTGNAINITNKENLTIGTVDAQTGIEAKSGTVVVTVAGADKTLKNDGTISGSEVTLRADQMDLGGGKVEAGSGRVTLIANTAGRSIELGSATETTKLVLSGKELDTITTTGVLQIGDTTAGSISITELINTAGVKTTTLVSGSTIGQTEALIEENLGVQSGGNIALTNPNNDVETLAANATGPGATISFNDSNRISLGVVDGITLVTTNNGQISITGRVTFTEAVESQFQSEYSPIWINERGRFGELLLSVVTEGFVAFPENPCKMNEQLMEEVGLYEGC